MLTNFRPVGKNCWDIRTPEGKRGQVRKQRGKYVARLTRPVDLHTLDACCFFVAELNAQR
jgi:hypothetical protein